MAPAAVAAGAFLVSCVPRRHGVCWRIAFLLWDNVDRQRMCQPPVAYAVLWNTVHLQVHLGVGSRHARLLQPHAHTTASAGQAQLMNVLSRAGHTYIHLLP
jgi:hypothetical protein